MTDVPAADTGARWTVDEDGQNLYWEGGGWSLHLLGHLRGGLPKMALAALVRDVRDAAEVPALRTHATTLARARRIAILTQEAADTKDYAAYDLGVGSLLDLLTGETDG